MLSGAIVKVQDRQRIKNKKTKIKSLKSSVTGLIMSKKVKDLITTKQELRFKVFMEAAEKGKKVLQRKVDKSTWQSRTKDIINSTEFNRARMRQEKKRIRKLRKVMSKNALIVANKRQMAIRRILIRNETWRTLHEDIPQSLQNMRLKNHKKLMYEPVHKPIYNKEKAYMNEWIIAGQLTTKTVVKSHKK